MENITLANRYRLKKGGKLPVKQIKQFINESYNDTSKENIDDFVLDKSLSNKVAKVYYDPKTTHAVIVHRGTKGATDWLNNIAYAVGAYKRTNRYKTGKAVQDATEAKYGTKNVSTLGHSQGSVLARRLGKNTKEIINLNPASFGEAIAPNEYNIKSSSDIVSALTPRDKKTIIIPSKKILDVVGEHLPDVLDSLNPEQMVGQGGALLKKIQSIQRTLGGSKNSGFIRRIIATDNQGKPYDKAIRKYMRPKAKKIKGDIISKYIIEHYSNGKTPKVEIKDVKSPLTAQQKKEQKKLYDKQRYKELREEKLPKQKQYYQDNKEARQAYQALYAIGKKKEDRIQGKKKEPIKKEPIKQEPIKKESIKKESIKKEPKKQVSFREYLTEFTKVLFDMPELKNIKNKNSAKTSALFDFSVIPKIDDNQLENIFFGLTWHLKNNFGEKESKIIIKAVEDKMTTERK